MKKYRVHVVTMAILLFLVSGLVLAQDGPVEPAAALTYEYNRDRLQYEGQVATPEPAAVAPVDYRLDRLQYEGQAAPARQEPISDFAPPTAALVPCPVAVTAATVCDVIATQPEDIVGVWSLYFQSQPAFIRFNLDGTWVLGNSLESTSDLNSASASGPYSFDDAGVFTSVSPGIPVDIVPEECQAGRYILRVVNVGGEPVALNHMVIEDCFVNRRTDWAYTMLRVSAE
jgi:hypothetical protein